MSITHRHVEVFRAIVQSGGLSAAARALHTSQPTLSRELALMEQRLGYALFERSGARLKATAAALKLFEAVQRHYVSLEHVQAAARDLGRADAQQLQLLALPALAHALVPVALAAWRNLNLGSLPTRVAITPAESPMLEAWMAEQRFDLGLTETLAPVSGCRTEPLAPAGALAEVAVLPTGHRLLSKAVLQAADFEGEPFISLADDDPYRAMTEAWLDAAQVRRPMLLQTHSAVAVCAMVAQGLGVAIVNPLTALACAGQQLHWRPLAQRLPFELALLRPLHRPAAAATEALVQALREATQRLALRLRP